MHLFPVIGGMSISEIKPADISNLIKPLIAKKELEAAYRVRAEISAAFSYAIAHGFTDYDPAQTVAAQLPPKKVWRYLVTKTDVQHIAPLSTQAIAILEELKPVTSNGRYVFPSRDGNDNQCLAAPSKQHSGR